MNSRDGDSNSSIPSSYKIKPKIYIPHRYDRLENQINAMLHTQNSRPVQGFKLNNSDTTEISNISTEDLRDQLIVQVDDTYVQHVRLLKQKQTNRPSQAINGEFNSQRAKISKRDSQYCQCPQKKILSADTQNETVKELKLIEIFSKPSNERNQRSKSLNSRPTSSSLNSDSIELSTNVSSTCIFSLNELITELNMNKDIATLINRFWKTKYDDLQQNIVAFQELEERTAQQCNFLKLIRQNERQHCKLLNLIDDSILSSNCSTTQMLKDSLANRFKQSCELLRTCDELNNKIVTNQKTLRNFHRSNSELAKELFNCLEQFNAAVTTKEKQETQSTRDTIEGLKKELADSKHTNEKNAQWACEQGVENKQLKLRVATLSQRNREDMEVINDLKKQLEYSKKNMNNISKPFAHACTNTEENLLLMLRSSESDEAPKLLNDLGIVLQTQRSRIQELMSLAGHSNSLALNETNHLELNENLKHTRKEMEEVRQRYVLMQRDVKRMANELTLKENSNKTLQSEVQTLTKSLKENVDRCSLYQQRLKQHEIELAKRDIMISVNHQELRKEKEEKEQLNNLIKELEEEKSRIQAEYDVTRSDLLHQEDIILNLEKTFHLQQREFEQQREIVDYEKEQALRAAHFATNKLMKTMEDFQKQHDNHSHIRIVLTRLLKEKDEQLKSIIDKMSSLAFDPRKIIDAFEKITPTWNSCTELEGIESPDSFQSAVTLTIDGDASMANTLSKSVTIKNKLQSHVACIQTVPGFTSEQGDAHNWYDAAKVHIEKFQKECDYYSNKMQRHNSIF